LFAQSFGSVDGHSGTIELFQAWLLRNHVTMQSLQTHAQTISTLITESFIVQILFFGIERRPGKQPGKQPTSTNIKQHQATSTNINQYQPTSSNI